MIAYTAEYAGGDIRPDDDRDRRGALVRRSTRCRELPPSVSIARRLIDATVARLRAQTRRGRPRRAC